MVWDQNGGQTYLFEDNFAFHRASLSVTVRKSHFQLMNLKKNVSPKIFWRFLYGPYDMVPGFLLKIDVLAKNDQNLDRN